MATNTLSSFIAPTRLRGLVRRARHLVLAQPPLVRVLLAATVVAGIASVMYLAGQPYSAYASKKYLAAGRPFSKDALNQIRRALDTGKVTYSVDRQSRVEVPPDQFEAATGLLAKLELGPRSVDEIRRDALITSFLDSDSDRQRREKLTHEKILEALIDRLDGVVGSTVMINQTRPTSGLRRTTKVSAFVHVETENDAELPYGTVEAIRKIVVKNVSDLAPDSVTVMDGKARMYTEADNSALAATTRDRAQGEQLRQEILEQLDWIKGVRVSVRIDSPTPAPQPKAAAPSATKHEAPSHTSESRDAAPARPLVAANAPLDVDAIAENPSAEARAPSEPKPAAPPEPKAEPSPQGKIGIEIPRSFYYFNYMAASSGEKQPSREEILRSMGPIETKVRQSVKMLIRGPSDAWEIHVDSIPDDVPLARTPPAPQIPDSRRQAIGWEAIGAVVVLVVVSAVSAIVRFGRRPEIRVASSGSRRVHRDSPSDPAPSERVRELVRRNPQAAASVLQRWVGQGGDA